MPDFYRIFDTTLECDFPLPELPSVGDENDSRAQTVPVTMGAGGLNQFEGQGFKTSFEWFNYDGSPACWCERRRVDRGDEYLYTFPERASYHISETGLISCYLHDGASQTMLRHLLLNQIVPRYLATTGRLVLHASAVTLASGESVAFLGRSGFGKSTLASSFHRHGAQLISDDCILLDRDQNGVTVVGGLEGIRLFPDSVNALFNESAGFTNYTPYTDKQQLLLRGQAGNDCPQPRALDTLFLLNDPGQEPSNDVRVGTVPGSTAMMAMIGGAFSLDPSDRELIISNFRNTAQVISEGVDIYTLCYPRDHSKLGEVRAAVNDLVA